MSCLNQRPRLQRSLALLACVCVAGGAQAATVEDSVDLLRLHADTATPATSTLERALTIDTNAGQRNLDLLLQARQAGETASPVRGAAPPALPAVQPRGTLVPLGLQSQDSVTAPGAAERREWLTNGPVNMPAGLSGGQVGGRGGWQEVADPRLDGRRADAAAPGRASQLLGGTLQFLRENRFWLLGCIVLLALGAASMQSLARRR
jgi:hypothetical protein